MSHYHFRDLARDVIFISAAIGVASWIVHVLTVAVAWGLA